MSRMDMRLCLYGRRARLTKGAIKGFIGAFLYGTLCAIAANFVDVI